MAQLLGLRGSALDLIAPLLTVSVVPGELDAGAARRRRDRPPGQLPARDQHDRAAAPRPPHADGGPGGETAEKAQEKPENHDEAEGELPIWARLAVGMERAWEQLRANMLMREGIDPDAADQAVSSPSRSSPAPPAPEQAPGSQGPAQPQASPSQTGLAPLPEAPRQDSRPGERTAVDVIDEAIAELAVEPFSGYRPEPQPTPDRDRADAISDDRLAPPLAAAMALASVESLARRIRSAQD